MLIFISDSVSLDVSGTEAEAAAAEGLCGDLNTEDLETTFLLMACRSVLFSAAYPYFECACHIWYVVSRTTSSQS